MRFGEVFVLFCDATGIAMIAVVKREKGEMENGILNVFLMICCFWRHG